MFKAFIIFQESKTASLTSNHSDLAQMLTVMLYLPFENKQV